VRIGKCQMCGAVGVWVNLMAIKRVVDGVSKAWRGEACGGCFDREGPPVPGRPRGRPGPPETNPSWDNVTRAYEEDR
jgi:hypothetical protein